MLKSGQLRVSLLLENRAVQHKFGNVDILVALEDE